MPKFHNIFMRTLTKGGATVSITGAVAPVTGYVVSDRGRSGQVDVDDFSPYEIEEYTLENSDVLSIPGVFLGTWLDRETDLVYLDCVVILEDAVSAETVCKQRGEIAYYDIAAEREVRV